jgi:hypothetical protein
MNKEYEFFIKNLSVLAIFLVALIVPEMAFAGNAAQGNFQEFVTNGVFKTVIDLGLLFLAAFQWFLYWNGWNPQNAFKDILGPAVITFIAFNWITVLGWVGLV